jgi:SAM-dependent methyltransferase
VKPREESIDPKKLINALSVDELCDRAEGFYQSIPDPMPHMGKPFSSLPDTPDLLCRLGLLLSGLKLGKSMAVLDFGAGTCWLSRILNQLQCVTISVDPSITALAIGKRLYEEFPPIGKVLQPPRFLHFRGHRIDIEDESVDRVICFDTFHHIPNQKEVLNEFFRVLKHGGIAGFCEPGPYHSQSHQSQRDMREYGVLENDILLGEIKQMAEEIGFSTLYLKQTNHPDIELNYDDYVELAFQRNLPEKVVDHVFVSMSHATIFFLVKGKYEADSRSHLGLKHTLDIPVLDYKVKLNVPLCIDITISNVGSAIWLYRNFQDIGAVKLGMHLYDANKNLINPEFFRSLFDEDVPPGRRITKRVSVTLSDRGIYYLGVDLVSEFVCWFESMGSEVRFVKVTVE